MPPVHHKAREVARSELTVNDGFDEWTPETHGGGLEAEEVPAYMF